MDALVNVNGKILAPEQAFVSVFDRGFLFGDGVYETGRTFERCPLYLQDHLTRLRRSAEKLRIRVPWTDGDLSARLFDTARAFNKPDIYYRMILTRGADAEVGLSGTGASDTTCVVIVQDLSASLSEKAAKGLALLTSTVVRNSALAHDPNIKSSNYLNSLMALQDVTARGGEDAVLCDAEGRVTEGTTFSIFGVAKDGTVRTPALAIGILDSITRRRVLELARPGHFCEEGFYKLDALRDSAEIFVASSVRGIVPVRSWDGHSYPVPGAVTALLRQGLADAYRQYAAVHEKF